MKTAILSLFLLLGVSAFAQSTKVVGYFPSYRFGLLDQIAYEQLTHLNLSFLNPADTLGTLTIGGQAIDPVVSKAKLAHPEIQVYVALAGGALTAEWAAAYDHYLQPAHRSEFIHLLMEYLVLHQLDGLDVDLEWSHVNSLYSPFVLELADSLTARDKGMTAALPGTYRYPEVSQAALDAFDWVNIMAYDLTGSWAPNNPGPHSPYSFAQQSISYWQGQGLPKERMTLGVPFYGYDFSQTPVTSFTFGAMVALDTAYAYQDQVGQRYYNGIPTIRAKTMLAQSETAGVMIWEIGQDALGNMGEFSLLDIIDETLGEPTGLPGQLTETFTLFPNPVQDLLQVQSPAQAQTASLRLRNLHGQLVWEQSLSLSGLTEVVDISQLASGLYLAELWEAGELLGRKKLVKE